MNNIQSYLVNKRYWNVYCVVLILHFGFSSKALAGDDLNKFDSWSIVLSSSASKAENFAANEFQTFFKKATDINIPITTTKKSKHFIFIGYNKLCDYEYISKEDYKGEEFRIIADSNHIIIAGGRSRGTIYGVYTFLEDYLGVRFLTADNTFVPELADQQIIGDIDYRYCPPLLYRNIYDGELIIPKNKKIKLFLVRSRINAPSTALPDYLGGTASYRLINHSFANQIPTGKYGVEHPEYYALFNGRRLSSTKNDAAGTQPCLTNPDVLKIVTDFVGKQIDAEPNIKNISVSQNDNYFYCRCGKCAAIDKIEGSSMGSLLQFVNNVADYTKQRHPEHKIGTLAYQYSRKPPKNIQPRDNVQIQLCSIECCIMHPINDLTCPKNVGFCNDIEGWGNICDEIFIWNYNTNFQNYLLPCPNLRVIGPNIRYFVLKGAKGIFVQGAYTTLAAELSDLRNYTTARILWNPCQDTEKLIDEFLRLHYDKAAGSIKDYITFLHDKTNSSGKHASSFGQARNYAIDDEVVQFGKKAFNKALKLSENDTIRNRVEKASICIYRAMLEPIWYIDQPTNLAQDQIEKLMPVVEKFFMTCTENGINVSDTDQAQDLFMLLVAQPQGVGDQIDPNMLQASLKLQSVVTEFLTLCSELNVSYVYIAACYLYQRVLEREQGLVHDMNEFKPLVKRFLKLCEKYNVTKSDEFTKMDSKKRQLFELVGLPQE